MHTPFLNSSICYWQSAVILIHFSKIIFDFHWWGGLSCRRSSLFLHPLRFLVLGLWRSFQGYWNQRVSKGSWSLEYQSANNLVQSDGSYSGADWFHPLHRSQGFYLSDDGWDLFRHLPIKWLWTSGSAGRGWSSGWDANRYGREAPSYRFCSLEI